jgi:hypothetical protein
LANRCRPATVADDLSVDEMVARYCEHARDCYRLPDGHAVAAVGGFDGSTPCGPFADPFQHAIVELAEL